MALSDISRPNVLEVLAEYDRIGQRGFFDKYGFEAATKFWLVHNNKAYASKAVANVAQALGMNRRYSHDIRLSGGEATVVRRLRELGFNVPAGASRQTRSSRSDTWCREELILALELYMRNPASPPGKASREVSELTSILATLALFRGADVGPKFRNANGVYLKMMNFRRFDPVFLAQGKKGMQRGGRLEEAVWNEFREDLPALRQASALIRSSLLDKTLVVELASISTDDAEGVEEGSVSYRLHKHYERDRKIVEQKKAAVLAETGSLRCECCDFDFAFAYGELGFGFIEAHHRKAVFKMQAGERTRKEDLALVCSNCHRMIHSRQEPLTVEAVKEALSQEGRARREMAADGA